VSDGETSFAPIAGHTVGGLLDALAAKQPVPGGGAAAGLVLATAAGLGSMVLRYSVGKKAFAEWNHELERALETCDRLRLEAIAAADADAAAYGELSSLWKLAEDDPARVARWQPAVEAAIAAPRSAMHLAATLLDVLEPLPSRTSKSIRSDLAIAAILADAAMRSAAWNVRINLPLLGDPSAASLEDAAIEQRLAHFRARAEAIEVACR
jgi:formiminotetrahydrofolate cyclodeaminase